ncbi:MAG TPA: thiamine diphosphokinase [Pseudogracilibacillus sp.]|nr:thiamine diphosphokinase [Pseudogracilibacillus sp.]
MSVVAIMASGPLDHIPELQAYNEEISTWIAADRGALTLINQGINVTYALGDFDSVTVEQKKLVQSKATYFAAYPVEKDETDLEIAIQKALELNPEKIYLFGVTGGRFDHTFINVQLLHTILEAGVQGIIIDSWNQLELTKPGKHSITKNEHFPYISFVPLTKEVTGISLSGFYYPLKQAAITWGSTLCISNQLLDQTGELSYKTGMLLAIKSRD